MEDDIIPSSDFFKLCDYGLKKYENSKKIRMISGTNYIGFKNYSNKYFFQNIILFGAGQLGEVLGKNMMLK